MVELIQKVRLTLKWTAKQIAQALNLTYSTVTGVLRMLKPHRTSHLEPAVITFKLFQASHHGCAHAAEFGPPFVKAGTTHPCSRHSLETGTPLLAYFRINRTWLPEKRDFFMQTLPADSLRKNSTSEHRYFPGGGLP